MIHFHFLFYFFLARQAFLKYDYDESNCDSLLSALLLSLHRCFHEEQLEQQPRQHNATSLQFTSPFFVPSKSILPSLSTIFFPSYLTSISFSSSCFLHFEPATEPSQRLALELLQRIRSPFVTSLTLEFDHYPNFDIGHTFRDCFPAILSLSIHGSRRTALPIDKLLCAFGSRLECLTIRIACPFRSSDWDAISSVHSLRHVTLLETHTGKVPVLSPAIFSAWLSACPAISTLTMSPSLLYRISASASSSHTPAAQSTSWKHQRMSEVGKFLHSIRASTCFRVFCKDPETNACFSLNA